MLANRIQVTTSTTGTGPLTLGSTGVRSATTGDCLAPAEVPELLNRRVPYVLVSGNSFASGMGTLNATGLTLTRDTYEVSWNGTTRSVALLSLTGTSTVLITDRAEDLTASTIGLSLAVSRAIVTL